jgi:hypothetical protein
MHFLYQNIKVLESGISIVPAMQESEAGKLLELWNSGRTWVNININYKDT